MKRQTTKILKSLLVLVSTIGVLGAVVNLVGNYTSKDSFNVSKKNVNRVVSTIDNDSVIDSLTLNDEINNLNELKKIYYKRLSYGFYLGNQEVTEFNFDDEYTLKVDIPEDSNYFAYHEEVKFSLLDLDDEIIKGHMTAINDRWGHNGSVTVMDDTVSYSNNQVDFTIKNVRNTGVIDRDTMQPLPIGGCMYSDKYFYNPKGIYSIYAKTDIRSDGFGMFAFWLTGYEFDEESQTYKDNSLKELTLELTYDSKLQYCAGNGSGSYDVNTKYPDINYENWHKYSIDYRGETAKFLVDNQVIGEIASENLPDMQYCRVNFGLLYPSYQLEYNSSTGKYYESSRLKAQHASVSCLTSYDADGNSIF